MSKKTIDINPDLFNIGKTSKTKKNREKKPLIAPIISPNILKNKLLKRIKEYKNKETDNLGKKNDLDIVVNDSIKDKNEILKPSLIDNNYAEDNSINLEKYTDEFTDSLNYLQSLTSQKKLNDEKSIYEKNKQKKLQELQRKTLKNHNQISQSSSPFVNLELPDSLKEVPSIHIETSEYKLKKDDSPPWGILKGGTKPTYRLWNKTQRHVQNASPSNALVINNKPTSNPELGERERKMAALKEKVRQKQEYDKQFLNKNNDLQLSTTRNENIQQNIEQNVEQNINTITTNPIKFERQVEISNNINKLGLIEDEKMNEIQRKGNQDNNVNILKSYDSIQNEKEGQIKPIAVKRIFKKTIRRKYTLGKSKIKRSVAVLLKDHKTKKKILEAYRELKREPIHNVKKKTRDSNLIKIGSTAPNSLIREIYQNAMLSGEINNTNPDNLIHNITKDESI